MSTAKRFLSLGLLAVTLIGLGSCRTTTPSPKPTPSVDSSGAGPVVVPFELSLELKGKNDSYCIEGFSKKGERQSQVIKSVDGMPFPKDPTSPPPANIGDVIKNVQYLSNSPVEVTDCKGKTLQKDLMYFGLDFVEKEQGILRTKSPGMDIYLSIQGIGDYKLSAPLESKDALEVTQVKGGAYPVGSASLKAKLQIPKKSGDRPHTYSFEGKASVAQ